MATEEKEQGSRIRSVRERSYSAQGESYMEMVDNGSRNGRNEEVLNETTQTTRTW